MRAFASSSLGSRRFPSWTPNLGDPLLLCGSYCEVLEEESKCQPHHHEGQIMKECPCPTNGRRQPHEQRLGLVVAFPRNERAMIPAACPGRKAQAFSCMIGLGGFQTRWLDWLISEAG